MDREASWVRACEELRARRGAPDEYRRAWGELFGLGERSTLPATPLWFPDEDARSSSNLARWMAELGVRSFREFHGWSVTHRADFWRQAVERVGVTFQTPARCVLDDSDGTQRAVWFPGARMSIFESLWRAPPDQPAIIAQAPGCPLRATTYRELQIEALRVAAAIRRMGWQPEDRLAVVLPMTSASVAIYLGILAAGCAVVSIADSFAPEEIANRLRIAGARAVFTYDRMQRAGKTLRLFERVAQATDLPIVVLPWEGERPQGELRSQDCAWGDFLADGPLESCEIANADACINVLFSSGTTGDPKAIVWRHLTAIKCGVDGYLHQDIRPGHVVVWPTNLGWMMGPWLIFASLLNRATIGLFEDAPVGAEFGRFVQDTKVNVLGVVPTIVKAWRASRCMEGWDWSRIHVFSSTGETSHPEDMFYLSSLAGMRPIIEYCGGTEIGGGYITSTVVEPNYPSAFTTAAVGLDFVLLDAEDQSAEAGELYLIPPSVGLSNRLLNRDHFETYYAGTPELADGTRLRRHGDYFQRLPVGVYVAGGRVDDTMNLGGIKVSSAEIERICNRVSGVRETAAVAVADQHGPDQLVMFVVASESQGEWDMQEAFNRELKEHLNPLFKVSRVVVVDALPRTASNKIMRRLLRDKLLQGDRSTKK